MSLISGTVSYTRFTVIEDIPSDFQTIAEGRLPRFSFKEIDPKKNSVMSYGWVACDNPMNTRVKLNQAYHGDYILLGLRVDRKTISPVMYKARCGQELRMIRQELRGKTLTRDRIQTMREEVKASMLAAVAPTTQVYEMAWDFSTGVVYFSSAARAVIDLFTELFSDTFELTLEEHDIISRTENFIENSTLSITYEDLHPSRFRN